MSAGESSNGAVRILCFDGGGPGTISQLLIVKEYMNRIAYDLDVEIEDVIPADYFDLMGGVSFGGFAAFLLGHLRLSVDKALEALFAVALMVFPNRDHDTATSEEMTLNLRKALEELLSKAGISPTALFYDKERSRGTCPVALYAATVSNVTHAHTFRTYRSRHAKLEATIVEALCATMALTPIFSAVEIGPHLRQQSFISADLGSSNPTRELLKEAGSLFGEDARIAQILSLGSGISRTLSLDSLPREGDLKGILRIMSDRAEMVAEELSARFVGVAAYLRLNVPRGLEDLEFGDWSRVGEIESHTAAYVEADGISRSIDRSVQALRDRIGSVTLQRLNSSATRKVIAKLPPPVSPHFVRRDATYDIMVRYLMETKSTGQRVFSMTGMGGSGKTQMVSYFLQENRKWYRQIVFVDASSAANIQGDLQTWARSLGDGHDKDVWEDSLFVLAGGLYEGKWILIFDNADDPALDLLRYFPKCYDGTIVITSRNRRLGLLSNTLHLELGSMNADEALSALLQASQRSSPPIGGELADAQALMEELGYLPLALGQAGAYCRQMSSLGQGDDLAFNFTQYLTLLRAHRARVLAKMAGGKTLDQYERSIYSTLGLSYNVLSERAKRTLCLLAAFDRSAISMDIFAASSNRRFMIGAEDPNMEDTDLQMRDHLTQLILLKGRWDELDVQELLLELSSLSMIYLGSVHGALVARIHPLIQSWAEDTLIASNSPSYFSMAAQIIACSSNRDDGLNQHLLPHAIHILEKARQDLSLSVRLAFASLLQEQGHYRQAETIYRDLLPAVKHLYGEENPATLAVMTDLAGTYSGQALLSQAEQLCQNILDIKRRVLGEDDPSTIQTMVKLSRAYSQHGKWIQAEALDRNVLDRRQIALPKDDLSILWSMANLGDTLREQGRLQEAEELEIQVVKQRTELLGENHLDTLAASANLADTYGEQGRLLEAKVLETEVMKRREELLGKNHTATVWAAANLACTLRELGAWREAETLEVDVYQQRVRMFGKDHPITMKALANLAWTRRVRGGDRWIESEKLGKEVLDRRTLILGSEHLDTIWAKADLARTYLLQAKWAEAERLDEEVLRRRRLAFSSEHPNTVFAMANLAEVYRFQGKLTEAESLGQEVVTLRDRRLQRDHPDNISARDSLAATYREQGRLNEAEGIERDVLERRRRVLGTTHPDAIWATFQLGTTLCAKEAWPEAKELLLDALEMSRKHFGDDHPDTIAVMAELALVLGGEGNGSEAEKLLSRAIDFSVRVIGEQHPFTARRMQHLAKLRG